MDPRMVGSPYNKDPNKVPLVSETPMSFRSDVKSGRDANTCAQHLLYRPW